MILSCDESVIEIIEELESFIVFDVRLRRGGLGGLDSVPSEGSSH